MSLKLILGLVVKMCTPDNLEAIRAVVEVVRHLRDSDGQPVTVEQLHAAWVELEASGARLESVSRGEG